MSINQDITRKVETTYPTQIYLGFNWYFPELDIPILENPVCYY